jgi:pyruvate,water dikinase
VPAEALVVPLEEIGSDDTARVGGKNAALGEMARELREEGIRLPGGFATTARAYRMFVEANGLEERIREEMGRLQETGVEEVGRTLREAFLEGGMPGPVAQAVREAYRRLGERYGTEEPDVAVRSSATAEDLPSASFAGQHDTFLNVRGEDALLEACRGCFASLFTDRAIGYREERGFDHLELALSAGVQRMVRADEAGAGVLFTLDPDTGFPDVVTIDAAWGLGESVVQGTVAPDRYTVYAPFLHDAGLAPIVGKRLGAKERKTVYGRGPDEPVREEETSEEERDAFVLSDEEILRLARWAARIETHYGRPMDVEWAKDGEDGELYVLQARPETVESRADAGRLTTVRLEEEGEELVSGVPIGRGAASGEVRVVTGRDGTDGLPEGSVLVTSMTDPGWLPLMRRAAAIVTDRGGRTSHAAIVSRELGIPAVVGAGDATERLEDGGEVTVSCARGSAGSVFRGALEIREEVVELEELPEIATPLMMNVAAPESALRWWRLPVRGVGLARLEYVINQAIRVHPLALTRFHELDDPETKEEIERLTRHHGDRTDYFVETLSRAIGTIAAVHHPDPVLVRMSDFKTNEYADLVGGRGFEPEEENPMLGWRGAARYYDEGYRDGFALECRAVRRAREEMGFRNVAIMIPFCRTTAEADRVLEVLAENGLVRGKDGLEVHVMAEVPSNVLEADAFAERFDGFSIGTNDLTQLALGVGRDSERVAHLFDAREPSVKRLVRELVETAHEHGTKVGICGEAPSDHPEFADFLVEIGIDSISLNPDSVLEVLRHLAGVDEQDGTGGSR